MTVAVILAGGLGTRLRSVVPNLPKPMAVVRDKPFLEFLLEYWAGQGISKFILSIGYKRELIINYFGREFSGIPISYIEEEKPLGTGGGLLLAAQNLTEPFLLLNGDTFFDVELDCLISFHKSKGSNLSFTLFRANESDRYGGVVLDACDRVMSLDSSKCKIGALANAGAYFVDPHALKSDSLTVGKWYSLEGDLIPNLLANGVNMFGFEGGRQFIDIGVPQDYLRAEEVLPKWEA